MSSADEGPIGGRVRALRDDWRLVVLGACGVAGSYLVVRLYAAHSSTLPVAILLLPVMAIALIAGPWATGATAALAATLGTALSASAPDEPDLPLRFAALLVGCVLATALSGARHHREEVVAEQRVELSVARRRESSERLMARMLERLPELSGARTVDDVTDRACRMARDLFEADHVSFWRLEGAHAVLVSRDPEGTAPKGTRMDRSLLHPRSHVMADSRTSWSRLSALDADDPRRAVMDGRGVRAGVSTPVRVDFRTVGVLALSWIEDRPPPDADWIQRLDRFADQIALAKTVVRRTLAQQENRDLTDRLQASFMPAEVQEVPNASVHLLYRPGLSQMLVGGDFLDVTVTAGGGTAFLIGDVSGHGPEQAALAAVVRAAWRGAISVSGTSLKEWVMALESVVQERRPSEGLFVTVVTGCLDPGMKHLEYISAGHPPPILLPTCKPLPLGGPPLGISPLSPSQDAHAISLGADEAVLLVTDGLFEGFTAPGSRERLGYDAFLDLVREQEHSLEADPALLDLLADRLETMNGGPLADDAAALLIVRRQDP